MFVVGMCCLVGVNCRSLFVVRCLLVFGVCSCCVMPVGVCCVCCF